MSSITQAQFFVGGDVMTGRGIDQILTHPCNPKIYESYVKNARDYVRLAEQINGKIPSRCHGEYLWGDGLYELKLRHPDFRLINLETSITLSSTPWPHKGINYRMHPGNIDAITDASIDACALANNHVLDWGVKGLLETITTLNKADIHHAGAGSTIYEAIKPVIGFISGFKGRVLVFSMGLCSSGIFQEWGATTNRPGVWLLGDLGSNTLRFIKESIEYYRKTNDLCIISIHWGGNWGDIIPEQHRRFAQMLIDEVGVNVIHGHSSHHPIGIELYNQSLILYGCGDLINDYEGIGGWEEFRGDLSLMYFFSFEEHLRLTKLELVPMVRKNFKLCYAGDKDCQWLTSKLINCSQEFKTTFELVDKVIYCL